MGTSYIFIEHDGKQLRTLNELVDWYMAKIKEFTNEDKDFNELPFNEAERKLVLGLLKDFKPADKESELFRSILGQYLASFLNGRFIVARDKNEPPKDHFPSILNWFNEQFDMLQDNDLKKKFIEKEIERTEKASLEWIQGGVDFKAKHLKAEFEAGQKYLMFLKLKILNFQHTSLFSAHEKIVQQYAHLLDIVPKTGTSVLLAELLENRLIIEAVNYKHILSDRWETLEFDPDYFRKFIPGTLYTEFIHNLYDRIKPLNNLEISRYLTLSVAQFESFHPEKREKEFVKKYSDAYWAPNLVDKINEHEEQSAKYVLKDFNSFYHLFKVATQKALDDFRSGLIGSIPMNQKLNSQNTHETLLKSLNNLDDISPEKQEFIMKMLEDLSITSDGRSILGERKKGALRGVLEAAIDKSILPQMSIHSHCLLFADKIGLKLNAKLAETYTSQEMKKKAIKYIAENYKR